MGRSIRFTSDSPETTRRLGADLGTACVPLSRGGLVVGLVGDLGAGKTVFARGVLHGLGVPRETPVRSPTFTVARVYRAGATEAFHVDAYHLRGPADLEAAGFEDMCGPGRLTVVEWADRVAEALPMDRLEVEIAHEPAETDAASGLRRLHVRALGPVSRAVLDRLAAVRAPSPP